MFYTYVIRSEKDGKWYAGSTNNLRKRFKEHNGNKIFSTKGRGPFELIYYEACVNEQDARVREKYLKSGFGKRYLKNRLKRFLSRTTSLRDKSPTGFTLLEIMVVVVIIAITIGGALFYGQGTYRRTSVKNAARDITSLMRMASSKALSERIYYNVVLSSGGCYLEKHYSGTVDGSIWEDISASSADETDDNYFVIDSSPGARKKLANVVDIDDGTGTTLGLRKIAFTLKETVMGITADNVMINATWTQSDVYSIYLDDNKSGTGKVKYLVTVDKDTARVKIYSTW